MIWLICRDPRRLIVQYTALWTIKATIAIRVAAPVNIYCLQPSSFGVKYSNSFNIRVMLLLFMIDDMNFLTNNVDIYGWYVYLRGNLKTKLCVENNKIQRNYSSTWKTRLVLRMISCSMFLEWWNTTKSLSNIWQHFSCLILDKRTAKICKKFNSHYGFLRTDQGRAKNCCQIGWIGCPILQVAQKTIVTLQFLAYFCNPLIK